jgi:hypothetical protein
MAGLAMAGLAMAGVAMAGLAMAGVAMAGLAMAGLACSVALSVDCGARQLRSAGLDAPLSSLSS